MSYISLLFAAITIILWGFLSFLGAALANVPPFLLTGVALSVSGLLGTLKLRSWFVPWSTFLIGVTGIFGYNFFFFSALQNAPVIEASLLNYLWPLLIVMLTPVFFKKFRLHWYHCLGSIIGFAGATLMIAGSQVKLDSSSVLGYCFAIIAALLWAIYSLLTKRVAPFSTGAVGGFCLTSGLLSLGVHFGTESLYAPTSTEWLYLVLLGCGPVGIAYFTWDAAMKKGDPRIIGSLCYLTPLLSTLILVILGGQELHFYTGVAMVLIVGGACLGSLDLFFAPRRSKNE